MPTSHNLRGALRALRAPKNLTQKILLHAGLVDRYTRTASPIGNVFVAFNDRGITSVQRASSARVFESAFAKKFRRNAVPAGEVSPKLARAVSGDERAIAKLAFDLESLSEFQRAVLRKAQEIPRGQVRSYAWVANAIGRPKAVRAVGTALARNPVPLLIPCHRVVRSDGAIGDYALGSPNKRRILRHEGALA